MFRKYRVTDRLFGKRISMRSKQYRILKRVFIDLGLISRQKKFVNKFEYMQYLIYKINGIKDLNHKIKIIKSSSVIPYYWTMYCEICGIATDAVTFESSGGSFVQFEGTCNEYIMHKMLS